MLCTMRQQLSCVCGVVKASSLDVLSVAERLSGRAKCPYDPSAVYAFVYSSQ